MDFVCWYTLNRKRRWEHVDRLVRQCALLGWIKPISFHMWKELISPQRDQELVCIIHMLLCVRDMYT